MCFRMKPPLQRCWRTSWVTSCCAIRWIRNTRFSGGCREEGTFRHFDFARTPEEEQAANQKGTELMSNSPYSERSGVAQLFL